MLVLYYFLNLRVFHKASKQHERTRCGWNPVEHEAQISRGFEQEDRKFENRMNRYWKDS